MDENDLKLQEYHNNRVAYFDSWVKSWIENRMEKDKQLLTLSALAIGLLVTVFLPKTGIQFIVWILAETGFVATILIVFNIFKKNADYIEVLLADHQAEIIEKIELGKREKQMTKNLNRMTACAFAAFITGVVLTALLAVIHSGFLHLSIGGIS